MYQAYYNSYLLMTKRITLAELADIEPRVLFMHNPLLRPEAIPIEDYDDVIDYFVSIGYFKIADELTKIKLDL